MLNKRHDFVPHTCKHMRKLALLTVQKLWSVYERVTMSIIKVTPPTCQSVARTLVFQETTNRQTRHDLDSVLFQEQHIPAYHRTSTSSVHVLSSWRIRSQPGYHATTQVSIPKRLQVNDRITYVELQPKLSSSQSELQFKFYLDVTWNGCVWKPER